MVRRTAVWSALETFERHRDPVSHYPRRVLPENLGTVHAFTASGAAPGLHEFFDGEGPRAVCGVRVLTRLGLEFNEEDPDACPKCVELVAQGVLSYPTGRPPRDTCRDVVQPGALAKDAAIGCCLPSGHSGPHKGPDCETWEMGAEDFTPAPDDYA